MRLILLFFAILLSCQQIDTKPNKLIVEKHKFNTTSQSDSLFTIKRQPFISMYPCDKCHKILPKTQNMWPLVHPKSQINHGPKNELVCTSCHDTTFYMNKVQGRSKNSIPYNFSDQLCSQCHLPQWEDWKKGLHGKRASSWAERRVIYNCAHCHSPHNPSLSPHIQSIIPNDSINYFFQKVMP